MLLKTLIENLSIRNKIAACFAIILLIVATLGAASVSRLATLNDTVDSLTGDSMLGLDQLSAMREALLRYRLAVARYMAGGEFFSDFDTAANKALATYREYDTKYAPTVIAPEEQALYAKIRDAMRDYQSATAPAVDLYHAHKAKEAWDLYVSNGAITKGEAVDVALSADRDYNTDVATQLTGQADTDYRTGLWIVGGLLAAAIILAASVGVRTRP